MHRAAPPQSVRRSAVRAGTAEREGADVNQMGNGNWASATTYANSILTLFSEARAYNGVR
ncbi:MAG TPA: hypothetical protein VNJ04_01550 [Gemmatimonadaceae bacterium]|nr:hypothetical protein [Gemmatimonadaceae bacterium]